jgi:anti-sigma factor RsiW
MVRADDEMSNPANFELNRALWQRCRTADAPENEAARFLDLAAFADGRLDAEERDRVAFLLAGDPDSAADVAAARTLSVASAPVGLDPLVADVIARADPLVTDAMPEHTRMLRFRAPARPIFHRFAQWGSLAAAIMVASWLGFAMGSGALLTLSLHNQISQPDQSSQGGDASFLPELLDPTTGFLRDLSTGQQT